MKNETPKYHLPDVRGELRASVLDLCIRRLWHEALDLLQQNGFNHYDRDDLMNFYGWAPARLPDEVVDQPKPEPGGPTADLRPPTADVCSSAPGVILLSDLRNIIRRYVVLPDLAAETLALWVVHTYAFTLREVTTYIGVVSPEKRCGKTTLLELLGLLSHEAITAANISPSALFRVIEEKQPTLVIDEADTFLQRRDEMAGILNAGYRKGNAYVVRVESKPRMGGRASSRAGLAESTIDPSIRSLANPSSSLSSRSSTHPSIHSSDHPRSSALAQYSCWCPKVMAAIGRLPDTLADRSIVITMQRKMPGEQCERMRRLNAAELHKRCAEFVAEHSQSIAQTCPEIPSALNDRAADIWEPLFAIADLAGGDWPRLAREAALKLSHSDDADITLIGYFLRDIRSLIYNRDTDRILSRDIVAALNPRHDRPWEDLRRGREINEYWLGRRMTELGINSRSIRSGPNVGKGYLLADINPAFERYFPDPELYSAKPPSSETS